MRTRGESIEKGCFLIEGRDEIVEKRKGFLCFALFALPNPTQTLCFLDDPPRMEMLLRQTMR